MARRSRPFSLSALTRAYQRNLKAFEKAAKPMRAQAVTALRAVPQLAKAAKLPRVPGGVPRPRRYRPASGDWLAGIAPGPAGARRFHLYTPPGPALQPGEAMPLLVMLHGCGQTGSDLAASSRMNRLAARKGFLVLYPEQERVANAHGCWNWFDRRSGKAQAEAATLLAAVDQVARRHPVDLTRVAVAGLSAGASMAALLGATYPERFRAVVMHSGVAPGTAESAATAMAAMHGKREAHLPDPPGASALFPGMRIDGTPLPRLPALMVLHGDADHVVSLRNATATAALWAQALGAREGAARMQQRGQRHAMRVTEYRLRSRTAVALREIVGLGHAWSGGTAGMPFSDPAGPDASALVWAFVSKQFEQK